MAIKENENAKDNNGIWPHWSTFEAPNGPGVHPQAQHFLATLATDAAHPYPLHSIAYAAPNPQPPGGPNSAAQQDPNSETSISENLFEKFFKK